MVFDDLKHAVNITHGSLHQAFLAWDKMGTGELSKARLRVGLRACRGANERDVEQFITILFPPDVRAAEKVTFNRLFQTFHEGERRFATDSIHKLLSPEKSSPEKLYEPITSLATFVTSGVSRDKSPIGSGPKPVTRTSTGASLYLRQKSSMEGGGEVYTTPTKPPTAPSRRSSSDNASTVTERRLSFDVTDEEAAELSRRKSNLISHGLSMSSTPTSSTIMNQSASSLPSSQSSLRFQKMREARAGPTSDSIGILSPRGTIVDTNPRQISPRQNPSNSFSRLFPSPSASINKSANMVFSPRSGSSSGLSSLSFNHQSVSPSKYLHLDGGANQLHIQSPNASTNLQESRPHSSTGTSWAQAPIAQSLGLKEPGSNEPGQSLTARITSMSAMSTINSSTKAQLKAHLLSLSGDSHTSSDKMIAPTDLRRSIHAVDPSLTREEVRLVAIALLQGDSPRRVPIGDVVAALETL